MKPAPKPAASLLRLTRLATWARLWLHLASYVLRTYFPAGSIPEWVARPLGVNIATVRALVMRVIFLRAVAQLKVNGSPRLLSRAMPGAFRAANGCALRRAMRGRSLSDQIEALLRILRDPEMFITRLVRRLRLGLTRLNTDAILPRPADVFAPSCDAPLLVRADSS